MGRTSAAIWPALLTLCLVGVSGCFNNNLNSTSGAGGSKKDGLAAQSPTSGVSGSTLSYLTLSRVIRSQDAPLTDFDLIGDGSGVIGQTCIDPSDPYKADGPSTCSCKYEYKLSNGTTTSFVAQTLYHEANMIQCSHSMLDFNQISSLTVKIAVESGGQQLESNGISINFTGSGIVSDTTSPASFAKVIRYQCRDAVYIPHHLDRIEGQGAGMYDPFMSENSEDHFFSFPLNFYTTNMGAAISHFVLNPATVPKDGAGWICPGIPQDTSTNENASDTNFDLRLYSLDGDSGNSKKIYPVSGEDRHTFYVAKNPGSGFSVPINAFIAPSTPTSAAGGANTPPPLGYGAPFLATGSSNDNEECPDSQVVIPTGYKWAKLWLFRGGLEPRIVKWSHQIEKVNHIGCNPGLFDDGTTDVFDSCSGGKTLLDWATDPAWRYLYSEGADQCVLPSFGSGQTFAFGEGLDWDFIPAGADAWSAQGTTTKDLMKILGFNVFYDSDPGTMDIDNGNSRWDAVFVVTPPNVTTYHMRNQTAEAKPYIPYRFSNPYKCAADDPDAAGCDVKYKINYGLELRDITQTEGGAPVDNPSVARQFPICVLQPSL